MVAGAPWWRTAAPDSPGRDSGSSMEVLRLFITAASHRFSNLSERHCSELFQSPVPPPAAPKQFW